MGIDSDAAIFVDHISGFLSSLLILPQPPPPQNPLVFPYLCYFQDEPSSSSCALRGLKSIFSYLTAERHSAQGPLFTDNPSLTVIVTQNYPPRPSYSPLPLLVPFRKQIHFFPPLRIHQYCFLLILLMRRVLPSKLFSIPVTRLLSSFLFLWRSCKHRSSLLFASVLLTEVDIRGFNHSRLKSFTSPIHPGCSIPLLTAIFFNVHLPVRPRFPLPVYQAFFSYQSPLEIWECFPYPKQSPPLAPPWPLLVCAKPLLLCAPSKL